MGSSAKRMNTGYHSNKGSLAGGTLVAMATLPHTVPGVSTMVMFLSTGDGSWLASNLFKNATPNRSRPLYGRFGETVRAFPGTTRSSAPSMTATNRSVVGSGPIRCPGKSRPRRYRMNCDNQNSGVVGWWVNDGVAIPVNMSTSFTVIVYGA